tara:strand:+ start:124 stop:1548 length:1425 start_codon:yes stop_codon:yes gene_type:complete
MKKIFLIFVLSTLFQNTLLADLQKRKYQAFIKWLNVNGYEQYLDKTGEPVGHALDRSVCKSTKTIAEYLSIKKCVGADGKIIPNSDLKFKKLYPTNLKVKISKQKWTLPEEAKPNLDTLIYYFYKYQYSHLENGSGTYNWDTFEINPKSQFYKFKTNLKEDKHVKKEMSKKALLSYLLYEDDKIKVDEISPKDRFGNFVNNETKLRSMSIGKTMVSYVMGHAICRGYIDSVDSRLNDWPLIKNTLYENQKIIDLLNMNAGDQNYVNRSNFKKHNGDVDTITTAESMKILYNSKKSQSKYNYNALVPHLLLNYISFKSDGFEKLLEDIFQNEAKIEHSVSFFKHPRNEQTYGNANSMFFATRYDYLRIAKSMLDDWQNDTCMGKYLKTLYKNQIPKGNFDQGFYDRDSFTGTKKYAGFFHTGYSGMKKRAVMGMSGYGGHEIIIDFDRSRIIVIHSMHVNYNWKKIAHSVIKNGM